MDTTGITTALDRIRDTQLQHGEMLRDHSDMLRGVLAEQARTTRFIRTIAPARDSSPPARSQNLSPEPLRLTAKDAMQWLMGIVVVIYVLKGGDIGLALKALAGG